MFYTLESEEFKQFIVNMLKSLQPRYYSRGELICEQDDSFKEALFIMEGNFQAGFFDMIFDDEGNEKNSKGWFKMSYYNFMHKPMLKNAGLDCDDDGKDDYDQIQLHCKLSIVGDYCMYYAKRSDIAYKCTESIMGYAIMRKDWLDIERNCLTELYQSAKQMAMRKYYNMWMTLKRLYYPSYVKWFRDAKNKPKLGIYVTNQEHPLFEKYKAGQQ